eukprot:CAMPEP_0119354502 /NCGR_PEP_ID=MMETSP1334-20130426/3497_1 /TAXON_ID=127549 /ORGANISM="Calcidiscus leptoporus, Strain RCC1130" /LENGTH=50 /DNA_ID=CAMNT_0007368077 /DNA_START=26 /DNA_END=175 /DNA_ORIENTATION=+
MARHAVLLVSLATLMPSCETAPVKPANDVVLANAKEAAHPEYIAHEHRAP